MASVTTYPSHSSVPAHVDEERLRSVLQRQQHEQTTSAPVPTFNYLIDVPISNSDVSRWATVFAEAERRLRTACKKKSDADASADGDVEEEEEEGLNSYFLNADAMLNHLATDAERKGSIYAQLAPYPPFDRNAVVTLPMTKILRFRREWLPYRQQFPLHQQRTQFLDALLRNDVLALVGAPGSGKTLQMPTVLTETDALKHRRVILVSANAVAARLTAVRLREERGEDQQSRNVAVALPLHNEATTGSVIVVTTAEVLLRQLLADPLLVDVGCVVVDDAHLRTAETEVCLSLLRERIAHHRMYESMRKGGESAAGAAGEASAVKTLRVFLNCPDEASATPLLDFFNADVPTTSTAYAGVLGTSSAASSAGSTVLLPHCTTSLFVLEGTSALSGPTTNTESGSASAGDGLIRGGNHFVHYVEQLVEWIHKCQTEGKSSLCADPENELQPHAESVDVVTRVMAASDADFSDLEKCREYWCVLIREAIQHYTQSPERSTESGASTVMVVAPNTTVARLIHDYLKGSLIAVRRGGNEEEESSEQCSAAFHFTLLDEHRTDYATFLAVAQRKDKFTGSAAHIILTTPDLAQTVIPPTVPIGLLIDCARTSYRSFNVNAVTDQFTTEYSSTQCLRHRRAIAASAKGVSSGVRGSGQDSKQEDGAASTFPFSSRFMTVQLIPESILHSVQHRRFSADPTLQHPAFRLSFERYIRLYQVFQAKEEAALYARQLAVQAGTASAYLPMSTVGRKTAQILTTNLVAVPSATSGNRYEHMARVFTLVENYLVAAGHIDVDATGSGTVGDLYASMKPLGALVTLLAGPLPVMVSRLLVLSALFSSEVVGTAVAAMWILGDAFNSSINNSLLDLATSATATSLQESDGAAKTPAELAEEEEELRELTKEARRFFSRDSLSDVVSGFYVYKMWLSMRGGADASTADGATVGEDEKAFLEECKVPRRLLMMIEATQRKLYDLLLRTGIGCATDGAEAQASLSAKVAALPDEAVLDGKMQAALTGALYPNCAVLEDQRDTRTSAMVLLDGLHVMSAGRSNVTGTTVTAKRYGVFSESSVVNDAETAASIVGKPFLFLDKVVGLSGTGTNAAYVAVLEQATPLQQEASIVFCGEGHMKPKPAPTRCRGWTPSLTLAWRHTRRARLLPPPAQLPTPSIPLVSYDTVKADSVIISTDDNFQFTMRATTSRWLLQLRKHFQDQMRGFLRNDQRGNWGGGKGSAVKAQTCFADVAQAWDWWWRRKKDGPNWLREERRVLQHRSGSRSNKDEEGGEGEEQSDEEEAGKKNLYGFYVFTTAAGVPQAETLPSAQPAGKKTAAASATEAAPAESVSVDAAAGGEAAGSRQRPKTFSGKRPSEDVDQVIRMCVEGIAKSRTREHEAQLLQDDPATFGFLNPENEFHEYYLYRLREAAPTLEVLGDSLEELIDYLQKLEVELREEIGYKEPTKAPRTAEASSSSRQQHHPYGGGANVAGRQEVEQLKQYSEVAGNEAEDYYYGSGAAGLQVEADASVRVKKQTGLNLAPKTNEAASQYRNNQNSSSNANSYTTGGGSATTAAPQTQPPATAAAGAATAPAMSGQQTLLEKLMAMKNASAGGGPAPSNTAATAAAVSPAPPATGPTPAPTAPISTQDLLATLLQSAPKVQPLQQPQSAPGSFKPPASNEELLAILTGAAPAVPPPKPQPTEEQAVTPFAAAEPPEQAEQRTGPTTDELRALLGVPVPSPDAMAGGGDLTGQSILAMPPQGFGMMPPMGPDPMGFYGNPMMMMMQPQQQQQSYYYSQQQQQQQNMFEEQTREPEVNPLTRPPPPLPAKVFDESPASVVVYPLPDKQRFGNTPLFLAQALGDELDMKVGPTTIVGRVARITVPNSKVAARALALRKFKCCGQKVYIFKNDRIIDNPDGVSSLPGDRARARAAANKRLRDNESARNCNYDNVATSQPFGNDRRQQQQRFRQQENEPFAPLEQRQRDEPPRRQEQEPEDDFGGEEEDPTSPSFHQAQENLPAGIEVGAFSDSDDDE